MTRCRIVYTFPDGEITTTKASYATMTEAILAAELTIMTCADEIASPSYSIKVVTYEEGDNTSHA